MLDLHGQLFDASGAPAVFVPVRLGGQSGPIVATEEDGTFVFPDVEAGEHILYAWDRFEQHIGVATVNLVPESEDDVTRVELEDCNDVLNEGAPDPAILEICFSDVGIDLPPSALSILINEVEFSAGTGFTDPYNTGTSIAVDEGSPREIFFSMHDGLASGGVREFTIENHRLEGAEPGSDPFGEPIFHITTRDRHGHQRYTVRDGVFRLEVAPGDGPTRSYVLTGTELLLDYGEPLGPFDFGYTLAVNILRLEGTIEVELPPAPPEGDLTLEVENPFVLADYGVTPAGKSLRLTILGGGRLDAAHLTLDPEQLALPGTVTIEPPIGDAPDLARASVLRMRPADDVSQWEFQLVAYTVTTEMTELPGCDEQLTVTLENLVFRFVSWDYDENSDRVDSFGDQTLTIDRIDVDTTINPNGDCF